MLNLRTHSQDRTTYTAFNDTVYKKGVLITM